MSIRIVWLLAALAVLPGVVRAEVPQVVADIAPVQALVARVMDGAGVPALAVPADASPHDYSLRPSEAAALQGAGMVVLSDPALAPWLVDRIGVLAPDARVLDLSAVDGVVLLPLRDAALFGGDDVDGHSDGRKDEHGDEHGDDHADADGHAHGDHDPHSWLMPANAALWLDAIAETLAALDPDHADLYRANARAGQGELAELQAEIAALLAPVRGTPFVVMHDAFQYFETAFELTALGAITRGDATAPSPAVVAAIRAAVVEQRVGCVLTEPQFGTGLVEAVTEGTGARSAVLDPIGAGLDPGPALYAQVLRSMAAALAGCL